MANENEQKKKTSDSEMNAYSRGNVFSGNVIAAWIKNDQKIEFSLELHHKNH